MLFDSDFFSRMFRMLPAKFEELLGLVGPKISRRYAPREAISPGERVSVTLRYLLTGDAFSTIAANYRLSDTTVGRIVKETCSALWDILFAKGYLYAPNDTSEWVKIAREFETTWSFPNCLGAIDGKHPLSV